MRVAAGLIALHLCGATAHVGSAQGNAAQQPRRDTRQWYEAYDEGVRAVEARNWQAGIESLLAAQRLRPQQGRRVSFYGDRVDAYVPDYYLGVAYLNLRRYAEAEVAFNRVQTGNLVSRGDRLFQAFETNAQSARVEAAVDRASQLARAGNLENAKSGLESVRLGGADRARVAALEALIAQEEGKAKAIVTAGATPIQSVPPNVPAGSVRGAGSTPPGTGTALPGGASPTATSAVGGTTATSASNIGVGPGAADLVTVPNLLGRSQREASAILASARLRPGNVSRLTRASRAPAGSVVDQVPRSGTRTARGTSVSLWVAAAPAATASSVGGPVPGLTEAGAIRAFFSGDYGEAASQLGALVADGGRGTPRARFFLASSLAALVLVGERDSSALETARQQLAETGSLAPLAADRRLVSPRILSSLGVQP